MKGAKVTEATFFTYFDGEGWVCRWELHGVVDIEPGVTPYGAMLNAEIAVRKLLGR